MNICLSDFRNPTRPEKLIPMLIILLEHILNGDLVMVMCLVHEFEKLLERFGIPGGDFVLFQQSLHLGHVRCELEDLAVVEIDAVVRAALEQFDVIPDILAQVVKSFFE